MSNRSSRPRGPRLLEHHVEHLRASGLTDDTILNAGVFSVTDPEEIRRLLCWGDSGPAPPAPAFVIPYTDDYCRVRPDGPRQDREGRAVKYEAPVGIPLRIYTPPPAGKAVEDPTVELWITEGEKKSLATCQVGIKAVVALPGVNTFHDIVARRKAQEKGKDLWRLHPDLERIVFPGREVTIVFDSDIDTNASVHAAAIRLIQLLTDRGAKVRFVYLNAPTPARKFGLDDLLVAVDGRSDAFMSTLGTSRRPTDPDGLLEWLSEHWESWILQEQERELERAVKLMAGLLSKSGQEAWANAAAGPLDRGRRILKKMFKKVLAERAKVAQASSGWMSAPGYRVFAAGPKRGVQKWNDTAGEYKPIASAPINIVGVGTDEEDNYYVEVRWLHGRRELSEIVRRDLISGQKFVQLSGLGAPVNAANYRGLQEFLQREEQYHERALAKLTCFANQGWTEDLSAFVVGETVIGGQGHFVGEVSPQFRAAIGARGDRTTYEEICRRTIAMSPIAEALWAAGFAGPLLRLLGVRSLLIAIWFASLGGKSAGQAAAVSAWGRPSGLMVTGDATLTAIEAMLAQCRDGVVWIDDTQQARGDWIFRQLAYQVGGGKGRARGNRTGKLREIADWKAVATVSGEKPLLEAGAPAGAANRTLEIYGRPMLSPSDARRLHQDLELHHGWSGPVFIEHLLDQYIRPGRLDDLRDEFRATEEELGEDGGDDEKTSQVALLALADYLARVSFLGEAPRVARRAALDMGSEILALVATQPDAGLDPVDTAYEAIVAWIAEHKSFAGSKNIGSSSQQYGIEVEHEGRRVAAILRVPLLRMAKEARFHLIATATALLERDLLVPGEATARGGHRLMRKTPALGPDRPRAYWIVLPDDEQDPPDGGGDPGDGAPGGGAHGGGGAPGDADLPVDGTCPTSEVGHGTDRGTEKDVQSCGVTPSCPTVPPDPPQMCIRKRNLRTGATEKKAQRTSVKRGTGGTVGQRGEEEEEGNGNSSITPSTSPSSPLHAAPVPLAVPPGSEVGQPPQVDGPPELARILVSTGFPTEILILDFETYWDAKYRIRLMSVAGYVNDPRFLVHGVALRRANRTTFEANAEQALADLTDELGEGWPGVTVVMHNAAFDAYILDRIFGIRLDHFICTRAMATAVCGRGHASLKVVADRFGLKPKGELNTLGLRRLTDAQLQELAEYAKHDADLTHEILPRLLSLLPRPEVELRLIEHTVRMGIERALILDRDGLKAIKRDDAQETRDLVRRTGLTAKALRSAKQFNDSLEAALVAVGEELPLKQGKKGPIPATAKTDPFMQKAVDHADLNVRALARARLAVTSSSQTRSRIDTLLRLDAAHGGIPPVLAYYAAHTARWSGSGIGLNLQNLPSRGGGPETRIREMLCATPGHLLVVVDLAQIEARTVAWVAGQDGLLGSFAGGLDTYSLFATGVFNEPVRKPLDSDPPDVAKRMKALRHVGKTAVLGLGYRMGAYRFWKQLQAAPELADLIASGELNPRSAVQVVHEYRRRYSSIAATWRALDEAALYVVDVGGFHDVGLLRFRRDEDGDLLLDLPSGRWLRYRNPRIVEEEREITALDDGGHPHKITFTSPQIVAGTPDDSNFHGGVFTENAVQAIARDILGEAILRIEDAGIPVFLHVHDEVVVEAPEAGALGALERVVEEMKRPPAWALDLPLDAEGWIGPRYGKH